MGMGQVGTGWGGCLVDFRDGICMGSMIMGLKLAKRSERAQKCLGFAVEIERDETQEQSRLDSWKWKDQLILQRVIKFVCKLQDKQSQSMTMT